MSTFNWCVVGDHEHCRRSYERYYHEQVKGKWRVVFTDETVECQCPKRGCPCYVKAADRKKTKTTRRKK